MYGPIENCSITKIVCNGSGYTVELKEGGVEEKFIFIVIITIINYCIHIDVVRIARLIEGYMFPTFNGLDFIILVRLC